MLQLWVTANPTGTTSVISLPSGSVTFPFSNTGTVQFGAIYVNICVYKLRITLHQYFATTCFKAVFCSFFMCVYGFMMSGKGAVCDCCTTWTFLLPFFHMWRLFCHYLFLVCPSLGATERLYFVIVTLSGYIHVYCCVLSVNVCSLFLLVSLVDCDLL